MRYDSSRSNQTPFTEFIAADYRCVCPNRCTGADNSTFVSGMPFGVLCAGGQVVREHTRRSAENVIYKLYAVVDRYVVLYLHAVAYLDVVAYVHVLAKLAVLADNAMALDVAEVPNLRPFADDYIIINNACRVHKIFTHLNRPLKSIVEHSLSGNLTVTPSAADL